MWRDGTESHATVGDASPTDCERPDTVVAWRQPDVPTTTFRATWAGTDDPSSRQVFEGIDDALDD